ncbi:MBL fold metallo-hydrolase [Alkalihalobacillus sp. CinArs1]|uniref:MBL fold metallo-hydrolase n=1 Tax=Alkalihalobacillus sp. CinArs1 TaxID=2995314 RepID=UPI0022DDAB85|nr:MBL fold metallo-hydrolase [Alkalihalobacillus sp. CinArs1]
MIQFQKKNVTVFQSSLYMTTSAVIETDDAVIMTDPNWLPVEVEGIKKYVESILGSKQLYIIYTHNDYDHIIGAGAFPNAVVIASEAFATYPDKEKIVQENREFDEARYLERSYEHVYPEVDVVVTHDEQKLEVGDVTLTFYKAPGHTDDGIFTVVEPYGIFLSGDYLSDVEFPFITGSYLDYVRTIEKAETIFSRYDIKLHVPGHGRTTEEKREMESRLDFTKHYLQQLPNEDDGLREHMKEKFTFFNFMSGVHDDNKMVAKRELGK